MAQARAARAGDLGVLDQRRAQALAREFEQAELADLAELDARAVHLHHAFEALFHLALVLVRLHVDEVDDHQATEIAKAQLAADFFGSFQIGAEGGFLDATAAGALGGVDVDGGERFGVVDHDRAAGGQLDGGFVRRLDLAFHLIAAEQRDVVLVELELVQVGRHGRLHLLAGLLVGGRVIHPHLADVRAQVVAQRAQDDVVFLVDQERRGLFGHGVGDGLPNLGEVVAVPLQLFGGAAHAIRANDHAHALRQYEVVERLAGFLAGLALGAAADATGLRVVGHQHQVAAGEAHIGGEGRALVAALFLLHLHDDLGAFGHEFLHVGRVVGRAGLVVALVDFLQRQKAVALGAVFDEAGFEGRLYAGDLALVDVGLALLAGSGFDVKIDQPLAVDDGNPQLFRLRGVDENTFHERGFQVVRATTASGRPCEGPGAPNGAAVRRWQ